MHGWNPKFWKKELLGQLVNLYRPFGCRANTSGMVLPERCIISRER